MHVSISSFWLPKAGNSVQEYEDAYACTPTRTADVPFRCAVADGATETSFSGLWANILAAAFVEERLNTLSGEVMTDLSSEWANQVANLTRHKPLPWYAEEKLQRGAFSSLLGLHLDPSGDWYALCVGDSCLFQIRRREIITAFPFDNPAQFNNRPTLIATDTGQNRRVNELTAGGDWEPGDTFLLMTDALAHYFLSYWQLERWRFLRIKRAKTFEAFIQTIRERKACRNDDVTLLRVSLDLAGDVRGLAEP